MEIDRSYEGREHSYIKHQLLRSYLEKLLFIKCMSGTNAITYVDCFAGPWGDKSDDLHATSIAISLEILKRVFDDFSARGKFVSMKAVYVEKNKACYDRLKAYLDSNTPNGIDSHPIYGDYSDNTDSILNHCRGSFAFFFIDPKKWTPISIAKLTPLLARRNSELLINFMYDFLNRALTQSNEKLRESVCSLLGSLTDEEINEISSLEPKDREQKVIRKYRVMLKANMLVSSNRTPRSFYSTVLDKDKEKTKYHLVYLTGHPKGIVEFAKLSENTEIIQRKVRFDVKQIRTGQSDLFGLDDTTIKQMGEAEIDEVKRYWLNRLGTREIVFTENELADMLEATDWWVSDFEKAFQELLAEGKVENLDAKRKRPIHPINFKKGENLRRVS